MPATARKPRFLFRELPGLLPKSRRHQRDQRAALSSKPVLVFLEQTGKWGGRYSHLDAVLEAYVAPPKPVWCNLEAPNAGDGSDCQLT